MERAAVSNTGILEDPLLESHVKDITFPNTARYFLYEPYHCFA